MARVFGGTSSDQLDSGSGNAGAANVVPPMSSSIWEYHTASTTNMLLSNIDAGFSTYFQYSLNASNVLVFTTLGGSANIGSSSTISANQWNSIVATTDGTVGGYNLYINGVRDGSSGGTNQATWGAYTSGGRLQIGSDALDSKWFTGRLADGAVWNVVLTAAEALALSQGARPYTIRPRNLKGYWPVDGLQSPEPDLSGNKINLTVTGTSLGPGPPVMQFTPRWNQFVPVVVSTTKPWPPFQLKAA